MKKKLMVLLALSCGGLSTNLQADWRKNVYECYALARLIIAEKIKRCNPFRKATAVDVEFEFDEKKPVPKFKKYRKKYTKSGKRIYYNNRRKK